MYELEEEDRPFLAGITYATNNQSPVNLQDLHANDPIQLRIQQALAETGLDYQRHRGPEAGFAITPQDLAESLLSAVVGRPDWARQRRADHFGSLYNTVFREDLDAETVQTVAALSFALKVSNDKGASGEHWFYYGRHYMLWRLFDSVDSPRMKQILGNPNALDPDRLRVADELVLIVRLLLRDPHPSRQQVSALFRRGKEVMAVWSDLDTHVATEVQRLTAMMSQFTSPAASAPTLLPRAGWLATYTQRLFPNIELGPLQAFVVPVPEE